MKYKKTIGERCFTVLNTSLMIFLAVIMLYPFLYVLMLSLTPYSEAVKAGLRIIPKKITFEAYAYILASEGFIRSFFISVLLVVTIMLYQLLLTSMAAYALTKKDLPGRSGIFLFIVITMFFSGGLIPTFILIKNLGLYNSIFSIIIPSGVNVFNMIVLKNFFNSVPAEMEESALIDGAGYPTIFFKIMVPLSIPSLCTIALFIAVGTWNEWYSPMLYLQDSDWWPMALRIRNIIIQGQIPPQAAYVPTERMLGDTVKMATVVLSVIPILTVYPSIQKYFVKGMMIGAVKS